MLCIASISQGNRGGKPTVLAVALSPFLEAERRVLSEVSGTEPAWETGCLNAERGGAPKDDPLVVVVRISQAALDAGVALAAECRDLRSRFGGARLVVIGPERSEAIVEALESGADDYIREGVTPEEVRARLRAHERASASTLPPPPESAPSRSSVLAFAPVNRCLVGPCGQVVLTLTEMKLLEYLSRRSPATAEDLAARLLGRSDTTGRGRDLVYRHVANLRRKLRQAYGVPVLLSTPAGYVLEDRDRVGFSGRSA